MKIQLAPIARKAPKRSEGLEGIAGIRITKKPEPFAPDFSVFCICKLTALSYGFV